jgi:hypothetical protein
MSGPAYRRIFHFRTIVTLSIGFRSIPGWDELLADFFLLGDGCAGHDDICSWTCSLKPRSIECADDPRAGIGQSICPGYLRFVSDAVLQAANQWSKFSMLRRVAGIDRVHLSDNLRGINSNESRCLQHRSAAYTQASTPFLLRCEPCVVFTPRRFVSSWSWSSMDLEKESRWLNVGINEESWRKSHD